MERQPPLSVHVAHDMGAGKPPRRRWRGAERSQGEPRPLAAVEHGGLRAVLRAADMGVCVWGELVRGGHLAADHRSRDTADAAVWEKDPRKESGLFRRDPAGGISAAGGPLPHHASGGDAAGAGAYTDRGLLLSPWQSENDGLLPCGVPDLPAGFWHDPLQYALLVVDEWDRLGEPRSALGGTGRSWRYQFLDL